MIQMTEREDYTPPEPEAPKGEVGKDFCQMCGSKTQYVGGVDYDMDEYQCTHCKAVHLFRLTYRNGKVVSSVLETIY